MALTAFTGTTSAATLNSNFDDKTTTIATQMQAGQKDQTVELRLTTLASTDELRGRSRAWVQADHAQLRIAYLRATDSGGAARSVTFTLTVDNSDDDYLVEFPVSITVTTIVGTVDSRASSATDYRTGVPWLRLVKGVRYRLTLSVASGTVTGPVYAGVQLRSRRRDA